MPGEVSRANNTNQIDRGKILNSFFIDLCTDVFGPQITVDTIDGSIDAVTQMYGGRSGYKATNIVLPNGSLDPWHALGIYSNPDNSVVPRLITGQSRVKHNLTVNIQYSYYLYPLPIT